MGKYDELVERLNARIEKQRSEHGNYFYNGVADPELAKAAAAIITLEAELAAMKARGDRLAEIARHASLCNFITGLGDGLCDCGLIQALAEWRDQ